MLIYGCLTGLNSVEYRLYKDNYEVNWDFQVLEDTTEEDDRKILSYSNNVNGYNVIDKHRIHDLLNDNSIDWNRPVFKELVYKLNSHREKWMRERDNFYLILDETL